MDMNGLPRIEPPADMRKAAMMTRQVYLAFIGAGFTRREAFSLTHAMMMNRPDS